MSGDATIREARDIISRWSSSDLLDRITSLPAIPELSSVSAGVLGAAQSAKPSETSGKNGSAAAESSDSDPLVSDFSDGQQSEQRSGDSNSPQDDTHSILADLDKLARRANVKSGDSENPSAAYLKLAEIDRPTHKEATIDVTDLMRSEPIKTDAANSHAANGDFSPNLSAGDQVPQRLKEHTAQSPQSSDDHFIPIQVAQQPVTEPSASQPSPEQSPVTQRTVAGPSVEDQRREDALAAAPSLSSLLKQSNSASVGQLAWAIDAKRSQVEQEQDQEALNQKTDSKKQSSDLFSANLPAVDVDDAAESSQSELPSQLRSGSKQTKIELDSEGRAESEEDPVNLTTSDQVAQNTAVAGFSGTQSEEVDADQPILPERESDDDQSGTYPASADSKRVAQSRKAQSRKQHPRKLKQAASVLDDDDQKGMNTVSRKYRVDNPNPESVEPAIASDQQSAPAGKTNSNSPGRRFRIDGAESMDGMLETGDARVRTQGRSRQRYIDEPHGNAIRGPHFEVVGKKRSNMASMTGQFLAYLGVLGLTVGTAIVIYGHFGGMSEYTPTGWLVTTVAQMMLFLGVINLVSGGIEQNNDDVSVRINTLGEQLMRIEQVTEQALRGPKIAASRYADPDSAPEETRTRETVEVNK